MKVAFVSVFDPNDREGREFNPIAYWMVQCMNDAGLDVDCLGPLKIHYRYLLALKKRVYGYMLRQRYYPWRDPLLVRAWSRALVTRVQSADIVLSGMSPGSQPIAYLETDKPIVIWTDATFAAASTQERPNLVRLAGESRRGALTNEAAALERCTLALYTSEWAARTAREAYGLDESRVRVLQFGPGMVIDHGTDQVEALIAKRSQTSCRLLLVGTRWHDKGGDVAVETASELNRRGLATELDIVGMHPPDGRQVPEFVHVHGFLRRGVADDERMLRRLYGESHFLILPTRAEACPGVVREASAFGLPSLASDVGGVSSVVRDGVTGRLMSLAAGHQEYADSVTALFETRESYEHIARNAFRDYEARLTWETIGAKLKLLLEEAVAVGTTSSRPPD